MKSLYKALLGAALCVGVATAALAQDAGVRNGNWWLKLPGQENKWAYLVGFFDGMGLGHRMSWWPLEADEKTSDMVPKVMDAYRSQVSRYMRNLDNQQLARELDGFYAEPKNKPIRLSDAVWIIANKLSGVPEAELRHEL